MHYLLPPLAVICEGESDKVVLTYLIQRVLAERNMQRRVELLAAHGHGIIPRMVRAVEARFDVRTIAVVLDSDGNPHKVHAEFRTKLPLNRYFFIVANPTVESWVLQAKRVPTQVSFETLTEYAKRLPLDAISIRHPEFNEFIEAVTTPWPGWQPGEPEP